MKNKELIEKYNAIGELTDFEQKELFVLMECFQKSIPETIKGGEELLKMCDGCAFKAGTVANNHPITIMEATQCVISGEPFYCHKRFSASKGNKLCNGWINVMNNK